jgi:hypothetical protein
LTDAQVAGWLRLSFALRQERRNLRRHLGIPERIDVGAAAMFGVKDDAQ